MFRISQIKAALAVFQNHFSGLLPFAGDNKVFFTIHDDNGTLTVIVNASVSIMAQGSDGIVVNGEAEITIGEDGKVVSAVARVDEHASTTIFPREE